MIVAFAMIYHGLGPRFQADRGSIGFGTLLYMSGSTFLTLGLGDITSRTPRPALHDPGGRDGLHLPRADHHLHALAGPGLRVREVGNLLIHSRAGRPPGAIKLLHRYAGPDRSGDPAGQSAQGRAMDGRDPPEPSLPSRAVVLPGAALGPIVAGLPDDRPRLLCPADRRAARTGRRAGEAHLSHGPPAAQGPERTPWASRSTSTVRETDRAGLPAVLAALEASAVPWRLGPRQSVQLLRLVRRYDSLVPLAAWLVIPLPGWVPAGRGAGGG